MKDQPNRIDPKRDCRIDIRKPGETTELDPRSHRARRSPSSETAH
jgi:hypothetical protein